MLPPPTLLLCAPAATHTTTPQVVSVPGGLSIKIAGQASGSSRGSNGGTRQSGSSSSSSSNAQDFQVDCLSGQANVRTAVPFKVPSGNSITCT